MIRGTSDKATTCHNAMAANIGSTTELIVRANEGDAAAINELFETLYRELHVLARARLRRNAPFTMLDTTALLHESYLRLVQSERLNVESWAHFLAYAARTMRSVVVDFARQKLAERRGGGLGELTINTEIADSIPGSAEDEIVRVNDALGELEKVDPQLVKVVEMRYFGGLTEQEIAQALAVTERTVRRHCIRSEARTWPARRSFSSWDWP